MRYVMEMNSEQKFKSAESDYGPQSGHIRPCSISPIRPYPPGKTAVFPKFSTFFRNRTIQKVLTANRVRIYQIKAHEKLYQMQKKSVGFDKLVF